MFSFCLFVGNCVIGKPKFNKISVFHLGDSSRERRSQRSLNLLNLICIIVQRNASVGISVNLANFFFVLGISVAADQVRKA